MSKSKRVWVVELIARTANVSNDIAEDVVARLMEEGVLHLGHGTAEIDIVVEQFQETFGTTKVTRQDRWAANRLVTKYGSQAVVGIIRLLGEKREEKFAPVVGSVAQMETKFVSVVSFLRKSSSESEVIQA